MTITQVALDPCTHGTFFRLMPMGTAQEEAGYEDGHMEQFFMEMVAVGKGDELTPGQAEIGRKILSEYMLHEALAEDPHGTQLDVYVYREGELSHIVAVTGLGRAVKVSAQYANREGHATRIYHHNTEVEVTDDVMEEVALTPRPGTCYGAMHVMFLDYCPN